MKLHLTARINKTAAEPEALNPEEWERLADKLEIIVEKDNGHLVLKAINGDELLKQVYSVTNVEEAKKRFREYLTEQIGLKLIEERIKSLKNRSKDWGHQMETQLEKINKKLDAVTVTKLPKIEIDELVRAVKENAERVKQGNEVNK